MFMKGSIYTLVQKDRPLCQEMLSKHLTWLEGELE